MSVVLVHGVPETAELWNPLRSCLVRRDVHALRLPGFGSPRPSGFAATKEAYVGWLIDELETLVHDGPRDSLVDLVGHDWGGGLVARVASLRPDLLRSWASDCAGLLDPAYEWHETARLFQTPEVGEAIIAQMISLPEYEQLHLYDGFGVPEGSPGLGAIDATMGACILMLYRSATRVGAEWTDEFHDVASPGLALLPAEDPFLPAVHTRAAAARAGARVVELAGQGHWWMLQDPAGAARVLESFWTSLPV